MVKVSIHPGHFGKGTGASAYIDEGVEAIRVAKRVHELVKGSIDSVYIQDTVNKSQNKNINWLVSKMNGSGADTHYSIHFNAHKRDARPKGTEVIVYGSKNSKHAGELSKAISDVSGLINRGVKYNTRLGVLRMTHKPAYLIEVCFVDSERDVKLYQKNFEKICKGIADTILKYHGVIPPRVEGGEDKQMKQEIAALKKEVADLRKLVGNGKAGKTLAKYVERGKGLGITDGSDAGHPITREQAIAMMVRLHDLLK